MSLNGVGEKIKFKPINFIGLGFQQKKKIKIRTKPTQSRTGWLYLDQLDLISTNIPNSIFRKRKRT